MMHGDKASLRAWAIAKVDKVSEQITEHYMECQDFDCPDYTFLRGLYEAYRAILWQLGVDVDDMEGDDGSTTTG